MAWLRRDDRETCQECLQEAIDQKIPTLKRRGYVEQYPCSRHGHPGILPPMLNAWIEFFLIIQPYCTPQTLPIELIDKICKEYGIAFTEAFERLTTILKIFTAKNEDRSDSERNQGSPKIFQEEG